MKQPCLACPLLRGSGGIAVYARTLLGALSPRPVEAIGYGDDQARFALPGDVRVLGVAHSKAAYAALLARRVMGRQPAQFIYAHIGLTAPLALLPRGGKHRHLLLLHGIEAWSEAPGSRAIGLSRLDTLVFTTHYTRDMFLSSNARHLAKDVESIVIPLSAAPGLEDLTPAAASASGPVRVVCVTRLERDEPLKGVSVLLRAARHFRPQELVIDVVGAGNGREDYAREASELGVADRVVFHGFTSDAERTRLIAASDLLCLPSAQEGFGIVFLEAMVLGRPCVGAAAGAVPEVLAPEVSALAPYGDDEALAAAIRETAARFRSGHITPASVRAFYDRRYAFPHFQRRWIEALDE